MSDSSFKKIIHDFRQLLPTWRHNPFYKGWGEILILCLNVLVRKLWAFRPGWTKDWYICTAWRTFPSLVWRIYILDLSCIKKNKVIIYWCILPEHNYHFTWERVPSAWPGLGDSSRVSASSPGFLEASLEQKQETERGNIWQRFPPMSYMSSEPVRVKWAEEPTKEP